MLPIRVSSRTLCHLSAQVNAGVNYAQVADRHLDDQRFEREKAFADKMNKDIAEGKMADEESTGQSATFDAFMRMQTGQAERTITDKINDKNRPTWDQYKKDNEDKLDLKAMMSTGFERTNLFKTVSVLASRIITHHASPRGAAQQPSGRASYVSRVEL